MFGLLSSILLPVDSAKCLNQTGKLLPQKLKKMSFQCTWLNLMLKMINPYPENMKSDDYLELNYFGMAKFIPSLTLEMDDLRMSMLNGPWKPTKRLNKLKKIELPKKNENWQK